MIWEKVVESEWLQTAILRRYVSLDAYVVMPNHFHGILLLHDEKRAIQRVAPTEKDRPAGLMPGSIGAIVGQFKSQVTKRLNKSTGRRSKEPFWQRNYYEHVIRDEDDLDRIREYIQNNPVRWLEDEYYAP